MNKYFFGIFTFVLGLIVGLFFQKLIYGIFPQDMDDIFKGAILAATVVVFFVIWRIVEKMTKKKDPNKLRQ